MRGWGRPPRALWSLLGPFVGLLLVPPQGRVVTARCCPQDVRLGGPWHSGGWTCPSCCSGRGDGSLVRGCSASVPGWRAWWARLGPHGPASRRLQGLGHAPRLPLPMEGVERRFILQEEAQVLVSG